MCTGFGHYTAGHAHQFKVERGYAHERSMHSVVSVVISLMAFTSMHLHICKVHWSMWRIHGQELS